MRPLAATLVALACCFTGTASAQLPVGGATGPDPAPYGTNDSGGFRNVLPPGPDDSRVNRPPLASTAVFEIDSPRPLPASPDPSATR